MKKFKKILILGSGALKIGEAGEFDYSGSQAIKALKEEGIKIVLINPNIATIQTSKFLADEVYFLPVTPEFVEKVIKKEKPNGLLLSFGGQTALNCGIALHKSGILKKYNVKILGTPISAIILTEDRQKFADHLAKIAIPTPTSHVAVTLKQAKSIAGKIKYPVMIRAGFALGGQGSGVAKNEGELEKIVNKALQFSPQVLVEKYLHHYKEVEYEVVRDDKDNCITVCNMENFDPLGIHTGESIVIAPSQTLNNEEYHGLRSASIKIVRSLGIVGECNVQFALNPLPAGRQANTFEYYVIEVNARLSRSSALASKATGYPLAYVAAKLALGYNLTQLTNKVTGVTKACFEPALDYLVVKIPRWDIEKFKGADEKIGTGMKSVGEVMGIGRTFEEAYQKAIRMLDLDFDGATSEKIFSDSEDILDRLKNPTPKRMFAIAKAIKKKISLDKIYDLTGIDKWFLQKIKNIVECEKSINKFSDLNSETLLKLKQLGFSDKQIGLKVAKKGLEIRRLRKKLKIVPSVFQIDTLAAEFPAKTNYLYLTYNGNQDDVKKLGKNGVIVLGSGPYRIGSSVEFDWTSVSTVTALKKYKKKSIVINCNPETVSTDYDISDRLYFEELTFERIADIYDFENPSGVIVSVGGQTPNNRLTSLNEYGCKILGTSPESVDRAEDRYKFSKLLDDLGIKQPYWKKFTNLKEVEEFADKVNAPILIRPSYVLSGSAMNICFNRSDLENYLKKAAIVSKEYPVIVSKFFERAMEIEFDAVSQNGDIKASVISEHVENAGVHSGDATVVLPPQNVNSTTQNRIEEIGRKISKALKITGPFNIQFLAKNNEVYVIELNLRASRTFPFISKVTGLNFIELFVDTLYKKSIKPIISNKLASHPERAERVEGSHSLNLKYVAVKVPQFSFARLTGADPVLNVEMASTGEVACFGQDLEEAFLKGVLSVGTKIPKKGIFISLGGEEKKQSFLSAAKNLANLNLPIFASGKTAQFLKDSGIKVNPIYKVWEGKTPNVLDLIKDKKVDLAINIVDRNIKKEVNDDYQIRRSAIDNNISLFTKIKIARLFARSLSKYAINNMQIKSWREYKS